MRQLPIKRSIGRIPGGMMIVPLFAGALTMKRLIRAGAGDEDPAGAGSV